MKRKKTESHIETFPLDGYFYHYFYQLKSRSHCGNNSGKFFGQLIRLRLVKCNKIIFYDF